ncbi:LPS assembly lipoprotein LptE [Porticoccaceae bacterium]|nr:LPS assembly lipoprotein LptE [Porticoccaceae bacterium]MDC0000611.1 LPS assembly lipoprotein LptE [Porticoccaceae bacterium]
MMKILLPIAMIFLLSACGWQLRNSQVVPTDLGSLYLSSNDAHSDLIQELTRALNVYGAKIVPSAADASYSVVIVDFRQTRRSGTINAAARVAEYQLNEEVDFLIVGADGAQLIPLSTASVERVYEFNEQDVLASDNEERRVKNGMREEIVRQILNRLRVVPSAGQQ